MVHLVDEGYLAVPERHKVLNLLIGDLFFDVLLFLLDHLEEVLIHHPLLAPQPGGVQLLLLTLLIPGVVLEEVLKLPICPGDCLCALA